MKFMREELKDTYGIMQLQDKILQVAVYIDDFCRKNNIEYFLMGGSALGAVRHKGFIPWDDDLDIFMTPKDYEVFREAFNKGGDKDTYYLQQLTLRDGMVASAKMRLNNSTYIEAATKDWKIHQGIFVDIFLLHSCPTNKILQITQCLAAKYILIKGQGWKNIKYTGIRGFIIKMLKFLPKNFGIKSALKKLYKYDGKETRFVCHFMGKAFFKEGIYETKYFKSVLRVPFEKVVLNAPCKTEEYLSGRFGDYMKMPPEETIKQAQHALIWDTEKNFSEYVGENDGSQEKYLV